VHGLDLPTSPADAAGIANLRVYQYHGFSTTSLPGSYSGNAVEIDPADANIVWNAAAQYWEVSFDVNGFSGFFVSSLNAALLPVKLVSFTGSMQGNEALLQWTSSSEINTHNFEVQRSTDGNAFKSIGAVRAAGNSASNLHYVYKDIVVPAPVYYYRLKMIDVDGRFSYSKVIKFLPAAVNLALTVYPNPARDFVLVNIPPAIKESKLLLINSSGQVVKTLIVPKGMSRQHIQVQGFASGIYRIVYQQSTTSFMIE
jgi:hypothetical protein